MNTNIKIRRRGQEGYALATVIVLGGVSLAILGSTLTWTSNNATLNERHNQYLSSLAAAEAATEKVLASLWTDYQSGGQAVVHSRLSSSSYAAMVPHSGESPFWGDYEFNNAHGTLGQTHVGMRSPWGDTPLTSQYQGLQGYAATFRIVSNARQVNSRFDITGAVGQDVQLTTIPLFQFAIFYNMDLEINPGPNMTVRGRVHSNGHLYSQPGATLRFLGDVTAAGEIIHDRMPLDPSNHSNGTIIYEAEHDGGVNSLNMPIGSDTSPTSVRQIVEQPPAGEDPDSEIGKERFYNKADMIVLVYDDRVEAFGGMETVGNPSIPWSTARTFISTNVAFFNKREGKTVKATVLNVGKLKDYNNTSNPIKTALGHDISSVYIQDLRTQSSDTQPGIKVVNGQTLPPSGLTIATPQPLYVQGHYNAPSSALGTANTSQTKPAAFIADAITILSQAWSDGNSTKSLGSRTAQSTTVNAAILAGIVQTTSASYSGGVENFPRFLEDWGGDTLTYNGSMIVMFESQVARALWRGTGSSIGIYNPPTRNWNFDNNFLDPLKLPPGTPAVRTLIRGQWTVLPPNTTEVEL